MSVQFCPYHGDGHDPVSCCVCAQIISDTEHDDGAAQPDAQKPLVEWTVKNTGGLPEPVCRKRNETVAALQRQVAERDAAMRELKDILWRECSEKHQLFPDEDGISDDYHVELTLSIRELKRFAAALAHYNEKP